MVISGNIRGSMELNVGNMTAAESSDGVVPPALASGLKAELEVDMDMNFGKPDFSVMRADVRVAVAMSFAGGGVKLNGNAAFTKPCVVPASVDLTLEIGRLGKAVQVEHIRLTLA